MSDPENNQDEVVEEPAKEVIIKKKMKTNACIPNMGLGSHYQNSVVQPLLTGIYVL